MVGRMELESLPPASRPDLLGIILLGPNGLEPTGPSRIRKQVSTCKGAVVRECLDSVSGKKTRYKAEGKRKGHQQNDSQIYAFSDLLLMLFFPKA